MTNTALILVDIQNDYFPDFEGSKMPLPDMGNAAQNAARLLVDARQTATMVVHIQHVVAAKSAPFFLLGTAGVGIHQSVSPLPSELLLQKTRPNSFVGTGLEKHLREAKIETLTICGAMSQMCIDATVRAAADLGFTVTVASDACAAANVEHDGTKVPAAMVHAAIMAPLSASYATVKPTAKCVFNP